MPGVKDTIQGIRDMILDVRADGDSTNTLIFRGTTENVARDGGILRAEGMDAKNFDKNPVVMWHHGMTMADDVPVIGRVVERTFDPSAKAWDFKIEFAVDDSELAARVFRMAKSGFIRAASVGFRIREFERDLTDEERQDLGIGPFGWVAKRWELLELSIVPVGADPDALKRAVDAGSLTDGDEALFSNANDRAAPNTDDDEGDEDIVVLDFTELREAISDLAANVKINSAALESLRVVLDAESLEGETTPDETGDDDGNEPTETERGDQAPTTSSAEGDRDDDETAEILRALDALRDRVAKKDEATHEQRDSGTTREAG